MRERRPPSSDVLHRKEAILLLAQRIAQLPSVPKKVLAMYYHENLRLAEIGARFGISEAKVCQILIRTLGLLRNYLMRNTVTSRLRNDGKKGQL